jgi:Na+-translocating ferredoxin:NAD+ oxidoreductase subunit B
MSRADLIDALLPQTQCTRCGYAGCRPYAEALASAEAKINRCPPGGAATIRALAALLSRPELPLDPDCGAEVAPQVAIIDESRCIGCARCLPPCPVDAIVGASRYMHTVLATDCTGCELCIAPCPVDCISLVPRSAIEACPTAPSTAENRARYKARNARDLRRTRERTELLAQRKLAARSEPLS